MIKVYESVPYYQLSLGFIIRSIQFSFSFGIRSTEDALTSTSDNGLDANDVSHIVRLDPYSLLSPDSL